MKACSLLYFVNTFGLNIFIEVGIAEEKQPRSALDSDDDSNLPRAISVAVGKQEYVDLPRYEHDNVWYDEGPQPLNRQAPFLLNWDWT